MKIWFVNPGEPLPIDNNQRLFRTGKIAERLKLNHEIIINSIQVITRKKPFINDFFYFFID